MVIATSARAALQANSARPAKATRKGRIFTFGLRALSAAPRLSVPRHTLCLKYGFGSSGLRRPIVNGPGGANKAIRTSGSDIFERLVREAWFARGLDWKGSKRPLPSNRQEGATIWPH